MQDSTKKIIVGVSIALLLCTGLCCLGSIAFFGLIDNSTTSVKSSFVVHTWESRLETLEKEGAHLPSRLPSRERVEHPKLSTLNYGELSVEFGPRQIPPTQRFGASHAQSALYTALVLASGEHEAVEDIVGHPNQKPLDLVTAVGLFSSCGPLVSIHPNEFDSGASDAHHIWVTEHGCYLGITTHEVSSQGSSFYVPKRLQMNAPPRMKGWLVWIDEEKVDREKAMRLAKKHIKDGETMIASRLRKARRAGMSADRFYAAEPLGRVDLIESLVPKLGEPSRTDVKLRRTHIEANYYHRVHGKEYVYKILAKDLGDKNMTHYMVIGETLEQAE